jgi:hypothetical protein
MIGNAENSTDGVETEESGSLQSAIEIIFEGAG